jgi:hypothetical protein
VKLATKHTLLITTISAYGMSFIRLIAKATMLKHGIHDYVNTTTHGIMTKNGTSDGSNSTRNDIND